MKLKLVSEANIEFPLAVSTWGFISFNNFASKNIRYKIYFFSVSQLLVFVRRGKGVFYIFFSFRKKFF